MCHLGGPLNQAGLKLNGTHQLLASADDISLLGNNIDTIHQNTGTSIDPNTEVALEVNLEKTKHLLLFHRQNLGLNRETNIRNRSSENMSYLQYMETIVRNQNLILEEHE
jgi:hypothetical protein